MTRVLAVAAVVAVLFLGGACGDDDGSGNAPGTTSTTDTTAADVTPEQCLGGGGAPAPEYVGVTEADAQAKAEAADVPFRVVGRDDECFVRTEDYLPNRVNVVVVDGRVAAASRF